MILPVVPLELRFHPKEKSKLSKKDFSESILPIVYFRRDEYAYLYYGKKYVSLTYYMCYAKNFAIGLNRVLPLNSSLGYHQQDVEIIRILFDYTTLIPEYVYFSAHAQEGVWVKFNDCEFNNTKLIVYVALRSHAVKPHPGTSVRIFGIANDRYSQNGKHITPLLIEDPSFPYTTLQNNEVFTSFTRRFLIPFFANKKDQYKEEQKKKEFEMNKHLLI